MSYMHSKHWEDAMFGEEHKRVRRKTCPECHLKFDKNGECPQDCGYTEKGLQKFGDVSSLKTL